MPPMMTRQMPMQVSLGTNGMVDSRLFFLLLGVVLGGGICMYVSTRSNRN